MPRKKQNAMIQLDVEDPYEERRSTDGKRLLRLNHAEIEEIKKKELIGKAVVLFVENSRTMPEIMKELGLDPGELSALVYSDAYPELRRAMSKKASDMFLSLDPTIRRGDIAKTLGLTEDQLRKLVDTKEFREYYNQFFLELASDPVIQATRKRIVEDLLPRALGVLEWELSDKAPSTVRQKARQDVFKLAGVREIEAKTNDRQEAARFLANVGVGKIEITVPAEYRQAVADLEVVDAEFVDSSDTPGDTG